MKIAFINQPFDAAVPGSLSGSVGILTYLFASRLARYCDVVIYHKGRPRFWAWKPKYDGVRYRYIANIPDKIISSTFPQKFADFTSVWQNFGYALQIATDLKRQKCDVVHIHNYSQFIPVIKALNPQIKIVLHMHCQWLKQLDYDMLSKRLKHVDTVIGTSDYITQQIRQRFPHMAERCHTVYNCVDEQLFQNHQSGDEIEQNQDTNKKYQLLFVGRISPEKGVHTILDAFPEVVRHYPNTELKIIGPGGYPGLKFFEALGGLNNEDPELSALECYYQGNYLSELKKKLTPETADKVTFMSHLPHSELPSIYQNADVLLLPSVCHEAFGIPLIEAMATGVPVVATQAGAFPEIVTNGETGFLVERSNPTQLAESILHLLKDDNHRKAMGNAARERVVTYFSSQKAAEDLFWHYKNIMARGGQS